jgi:hypothetical protein
MMPIATSGRHIDCSSSESEALDAIAAPVARPDARTLHLAMKPEERKSTGHSRFTLTVFRAIDASFARLAT